MEGVKIEFLDLKYLLFSGTEGGIPPLTENHSAQESLLELEVLFRSL